MIHRARHHAPLLTMGLMLGIESALGAGLPPPPGSAGPARSGAAPVPPLRDSRGQLCHPLPAQKAALGVTLYLELVVNGRPMDEVVPVQMRGGRFYVASDVLLRHRVRLPPDAPALVALDLIREVAVDYDSVSQQLKLQLPAAWLPTQELGPTSPLRPWEAASDLGFLLNYDIYSSDLSGPETQTSIWTELRLFGAWGVASNTGIQQDAFGTENQYLRYDTRWTWSDPDTVRTFTVGDLITGALPWGSAVRLGGVQIARNFSVRPDLVPYPLPQFYGQAALPSSVDLFINGHKAGNEVVQPGPFKLNAMPFINGAGEATVVTTDALGRQVLTTVPFYVTSTLLKTGTTDYALAVGALREDYGIDNFSYGDAAYALSYRRGMDNSWTLEGRAEGTRDLTVLGAGSVFTLGHYGVVNFSLSGSHNGAEPARRQGLQHSYGYQYNAQRFSLGMQRTQRTEDYASLSTLGPGTSGASLASSQVNGSVSLGAAGAASLAYFDVLSADRYHTRLASLNYTLPIDSSNFVSVNLNRTLGTDNYGILLQWTLLLDSLSSVSVTGTRDKLGYGGQVQYSSSPPASGGFGWNLSHADAQGQNAYQQASGTWRLQTTQLQAGVYAFQDRSTSWANATGSVVVMDGGVFAANRINDAFAVVSTSGVADVPVRFENQLVGQTNDRGHLLVTGVNAYYPSRFEIDTLDLPDYQRALQTEQRAVLRAGSGAVLRFDLVQIKAVSLTLVDEGGKPVPMGRLVELVGTGQVTVVGWDGQVYLEGVGTDNELLVRGADQPSCRVRFTLSSDAPAVQRLAPLVCRPATSLPRLSEGGSPGLMRARTLAVAGAP